jgi:hypothetical protein
MKCSGSCLAPVPLFAYNRPAHTLRTLRSLVADPEAAQIDLHVFADGPKEDATLEDYLHELQAVRTACSRNHRVSAGGRRIIKPTGRCLCPWRRHDEASRNGFQGEHKFRERNPEGAGLFRVVSRGR